MTRTASLYDVPRKAVWDAHAPYVEGAFDALVCFCVGSPLSADARNALVKSAQAIGYGNNQMAFISVDSLDPADVQTLIEAIDPLCVVATDTSATRVLSQAYHAPLHLGIKDYVAGRPCCCFEQLNDVVSDATSKQKTWRLLKSTLALFS